MGIVADAAIPTMIPHIRDLCAAHAEILGSICVWWKFSVRKKMVEYLARVKSNLYIGELFNFGNP